MAMLNLCTNYTSRERQNQKYLYQSVSGAPYPAQRNTWHMCMNSGTRLNLKRVEKNKNEKQQKS